MKTKVESILQELSVGKSDGVRDSSKEERQETDSKINLLQNENEKLKQKMETIVQQLDTKHIIPRDFMVQEPDSEYASSRIKALEMENEEMKKNMEKILEMLPVGNNTSLSKEFYYGRMVAQHVASVTVLTMLGFVVDKCNRFFSRSK
jgi:predicted RNase H-like nuclease (RuvC/YqgF family)